MHHISREKGYYLPLSYNDNKIVLLVKDPYYLFAYWEISNDRKENFTNQFGENSWVNSKPVIKLTNVTLNKTDYIYIDDFCNNWYINVNEPNCIFTAEIGRIFENDLFVALAESNTAYTPTDKVSTCEAVTFAAFNNVPETTTVKVAATTNLGKYDYAAKDTAEISIGLSSAEVSGMNLINGISSEVLLNKKA